MARKSTVRKKSTNSKNKNLSLTTKISNKVRQKYVFIFIVLFAFVGVYALLQANAKPKFSEDPKDVVFAYYDSRPTMIEQKDSQITYESYSASNIVLADGTVLCDDGNSAGDVRTGKLGYGIVKKLVSETEELKLNTLPRSISGDVTAPQVGDHEGFLVTINGEKQAFEVHKDGIKPDKLAKLQQKIAKLCEQTDKTNKRNENSFNVPGKKVTAETGFLNKIANVIVPKVSACCAPTQQNATLANDQAARTTKRRSSLRLASLPRKACMDEAAYHHAKRMAEQDNLHHNPNMVNEMLYICYKEGLRDNNWTMMGENVGKVANNDSAALFNAYVNSPGHRANLDSRSARYMGHGAYKNLNNGITYHTYLIAAW